MRQRSYYLRLWGIAASVAIGLFASVVLVQAFAEEPITYRDPYTHEPCSGEGCEEISTLHADLTYALALAAGFSVSDSQTLELWNQLVDSEVLGPGDAVSYTNCLGSFGLRPLPLLVCPLGTGSGPTAWPMWSWMQDQDTCATSRFGPSMPFFHFPRNTPQELGALHDWGWGMTDTLSGYEAYAWGAHNVVSATCRYTRSVAIDTGLEAGSLPAFATYLHSLADYYSHRDCIAAMDALGMPWPTHTLTGVPACDYNPLDPQPDDVHGREFLTYTDSLRTDEAIQAVYAELVARSLQREGQYIPIELDEPISGTQTLSDVLHTFVHAWGFDQPGPDNRRALTDQLAGHVLAQRRPLQRVYLPLILRETPSTVLKTCGVRR